jgi:HPt (histidine-containing phosphotransfer) domain-containing protein
MLNILIVEDDDKFRQLVARLLTDRGFKVVAAASLAEADEALRSNSFDLIVHKPVQPRIFVDEICQIVSYTFDADHADDCVASRDLLQLAAEFVQELPDRIYTLIGSLIGCEEGLPGAFDEAVSEAHRLRGTGGVFGQPWVSDMAAEIEDTLKKLPVATGSADVQAEKFRALIGLASKAFIRAQSIPALEFTSTENSTSRSQETLNEVAGA